MRSKVNNERYVKAQGISVSLTEKPDNEKELMQFSRDSFCHSIVMGMDKVSNHQNDEALISVG